MTDHSLLILFHVFFSSWSLDKPEVTLHHGQNIISNLNLLVIENDALTIDCRIQANPPVNQSHNLAQK